MGDFNAWNLNKPRERFWQARTRQVGGCAHHTYARLWSCLPYLRPMLTLTRDTIPREPSIHGGRCHDLLGSRCDPYLYKLADGRNVDITCHSNLPRAIAPYHLTELDVHDVLNIFQVTGLDSVHEGYFMEPSPARKGDFIEFFAEIDLLCALSTCPAGDLSVRPWGPEKADPSVTCKALGVEVRELPSEVLLSLDGRVSPEPVQIDSVYSQSDESATQ